MSDNPLFADVIVNVDAAEVDRPFQYRVPAQWSDLAQEGACVRVPFGPRRMDGIVVGLSDHAAVSGVRDILGPGAAPAVPRPSLDVARWLRETVGCLWVEAIRAVSPPGQFGSTTRRLSAGDPPPDQLNPLERKILALVRRRPATISRLSRDAMGDVRATVQRMVAQGTLRQTKRPARARVPVVTRYQAVAPAGPDSVGERAFRQRQVLTALGGDRLTVREIAHSTALPPSVVSGALTRLVNRGLVTAETQQLRRAPSVPGIRADGGRPQLTPAQQLAVERIGTGIEAGTGRYLLHGVTGSGKTEVYLWAIERALEMGRTALYLVPEISLTPQMLDIFASRLGGDAIAVLHSGLSIGERYEQWQRVFHRGACVVMGARSAALAPVDSPAVVIVDEEHETSYKQQDSPRYHARDLAQRRAENGVCILGSATPSLESYYRALTGGLELLRLDRRIDDRPLPTVSIVDMRTEIAAGNRTMFSHELSDNLKQTLSAGEQAILFVNRRGYAPFILCRDCGHVIRCPDCDVSLVYHQPLDRLLCHYCNREQAPPDVCPGCGGVRIRQFGAGTQRVQEAFEQAFPGIKCVRMDVDTTRTKGAHLRLWSEFAQGRAQVMIGTQMVAKGWDLPSITTVGVVTADTALHHPDFRAAERTFQLLTQVAGRAGRGKRPGRVVLQTYSPGHYAIAAAARQDYGLFYEKEIETRREFGYPPFSRMVLVVVSGPDEQAVGERAAAIAAGLQSEGNLLGPAPAPLRRIRGNYRWQVILFLDDVGPDITAKLREISRSARDATMVTFDIDPTSTM